MDRHPIKGKADRGEGGGFGQARQLAGRGVGGGGCLLLVSFGGEAGPGSQAAGGHHLQALPQQCLCTVNQAEACQVHPIQHLHPHSPSPHCFL